MILSILVPTVAGREHPFTLLIAEIEKQIEEADLSNEVEVLTYFDNKEISIGAKRQRLLLNAKGDYVVFIDDDDWINPAYVHKIVLAIRAFNPDCIGFKIHCTFDLNTKRSAIASNRYDKWEDNKDGFHYVRTIYHKTPHRRDIALQIGYQNLRFGEDHDYSTRLKASGLLKQEYFIDEVMYFYRYSSKEPAHIKYGYNKQ